MDKTVEIPQDLFAEMMREYEDRLEELGQSYKRELAKIKTGKRRHNNCYWLERIEQEGKRAAKIYTGLRVAELDALR